MFDWFIKKSDYIQKQFKLVSKGFKKRDQEIEKNKLAIAQLQGAMEVLMKKQVQVQVQTKSKPSLRQTQEKRVIQRFRTSKKQISKQKILNYVVKEGMAVPDVCFKLMSALKISKASYYNYVRELIQEGSLSPSLSPKSVLSRQKLDK